MKRTAVESTSIALVGYDNESRTLEIQFVHGGVYQYGSVPPEDYERLLAAGSKGGFFREEIRDVYECFKVPKRFSRR